MYLLLLLFALLPIRLDAEPPKVEALVQVWGHQLVGEALRHNSPAWPYAPLPLGMNESGVAVRRAELWLTGTVGEGVSYTVMDDLALTGNGLLVAQAAYQRGPWEVRAGSFRSAQTWEGIQRDADLLLAERFQVARVFADKSDWGALVGRSLGGTRWKVLVGVFNGGGRSAEKNDEKDLIARVQFKQGAHAAGIYGLRGATDLPDKGLQAGLFPGAGVPEAATVLAHQDRTTNLGGYYVHEKGAWLAHTEAVGGQWGRRYPSLVTTPGAAAREHLDQRFLNLVGTLAYIRGKHTLALRLDRLDANWGDRWYGEASPYGRNGVEIPPVYTETTLGYRFAFKPAAVREANIKVNWIQRSRFLTPLAGQSRAQGSSSLLVALQVMQ